MLNTTKQVIKKYDAHINDIDYTIEYVFIKDIFIDAEIKIKKPMTEEKRIYFSTAKDFDDFLNFLNSTREDI